MTVAIGNHVKFDFFSHYSDSACVFAIKKINKIPMDHIDYLRIYDIQKQASVEL